MPRRNGKTGNRHSTTKQKGRSRRGSLSTYCRMAKWRKADRYDRPYLEGTYNKSLEP